MNNLSIRSAIGSDAGVTEARKHGLFAELPKSYEINRLYFSPLTEQFLHICEALNDSGKEDRATLSSEAK
jgi:hypothetical protein